MNDQAPYQSPQLDQVLHTILQATEGMLYSKSDVALKNVALVGMLLTDTDSVKNGQIVPEDIYHADSAMLKRSFNALSKAGVPLHPEARFQIYNILPPVRSDYLLAALDYECLDYPKNDVSILMYLPKYGKTPRDRFYLGNKGFQSYETDELFSDQAQRKFTAASQLHHDFNIWAQAADKLGSKFVMILGGVDDDLTTQQFEGHKTFKTLIDSAENQCKKGLRNRNNLGVVVRADAMQALSSHVEPDSEIGAALIHAMD